ncbi:MAG TPA: DNA-binding protein [Firmicutes bacterium]|nr:DNA-binding protein [Bacillota bacterium]
MIGQMHAYRCEKCGRLYHPARLVCRQCGGREFEPVPLEGEAILVTYTRVYNLPEGYMKPWLSFGVAEFPNGVRVSGQLGTEDLVLGRKLKATVGLVKEGGLDGGHEGFIFQAPD